MIQVYRTVGEEFLETTVLREKGNWINLINPSEEEILEVSSAFCINPDLLKAPLDEEERSRIESEDGQVLILIKIPTKESSKQFLKYDTVPLGIILSEECVITVCLEKNILIEEFARRKVKSFYTFKRTRFVFQILFRAASLYLRYLREIDRKTSDIEAVLQKSMRNEEVVSLLNLGKSLVYFTTSLKANQLVMEKLLRSKILKMYEEDEDLLQDVIIENKQAIEMSEIYSNILNGTMDAFASVISNNLNIVMKFLTSVTIILSIPTIVTSFYGMNVNLPFQQQPHAYLITLLLSLGLSAGAVFMLARRGMF